MATSTARSPTPTGFAETVSDYSGPCYTSQARYTAVWLRSESSAVDFVTHSLFLKEEGVSAVLSYQQPLQIG
jgi:hypothetical protein